MLHHKKKQRETKCLDSWHIKKNYLLHPLVYLSLFHSSLSQKKALIVIENEYYIYNDDDDI